jgi:protein-L-isoaspartate(D-aspartate) O-methyltransferase
MLEKLNLKEKDKVLEIGSGSGWNSALISFITKAEVFSVEFDEKVAGFAKKNLDKQKISNVRIILDDGNKGYEKEKPYDKIMVTAACSKMPFDLIKQLKNNGVLLAPIGALFEQDLMKITKKGKEIRKENLGKFVFVPLKGKYGF